MSSDYDRLFDIFNNINIIMITNNLSIKDKIKKKIEIITALSYSNIDVLNYNSDKKENLFNILNSINNKLMSVKKNQNKLNIKLNTILGKLIHNSYISSGFQVLISNIPNIAKNSIYINNNNNNKNFINVIDSESIYDTIEHYIGNNTLLTVIQIDSDKYLAKFKNINDAKKLCNLINNMMIEPNIIKAELIDVVDTMDTMDTMDTIDTNLEKETINVKEKVINTKFENSIYDNDICDYGVSKSSVFKICINLVYEKYKNIQKKIKNSINYLISFIYEKP